MKRTTMLLAAVLAGAMGCGEKTGTGSATGQGSAAPAGGSATAVVASASASANVMASAVPTASAVATETEAAGPEPTKKYDCGAKTQKPCPMQGWMKKVMAPASSSGDGEKLAEAMAYVAKRPPPGYPEWVAISKEGVAKAKKGDVDGAKATCKKCHDLYKEDYKAKMRDRVW